MELKDMLPTGPNLPVEQDIMHLARLGELAAIQQLIDDGNDVNYTDEEGITPLHVSKCLCHGVETLLVENVLMVYVSTVLVGSDQQSLRGLQISDRSWS
jgi:hypothetical protein